MKDDRTEPPLLQSFSNEGLFLSSVYVLVRVQGDRSWVELHAGYLGEMFSGATPVRKWGHEDWAKEKTELIP